jgi:HPt (histidine-containing phosphotransfer) domain-containing protein
MYQGEKMSVDPTALEPYREVMGEEADAFIAEIIGMFMANAPKLIEQMQQNIAINDNMTFIRNAHTLKSNSATVGAMALSKLLASLEQRGEQADLQSLAGLLNEARAELELVIAVFKKFLYRTNKGNQS